MLCLSGMRGVQTPPPLSFNAEQPFFARQLSPEAEAERKRRKRRCVSTWILAVLGVVVLVAVDYVILLRKKPMPGQRLVKLRLFWVRHGLSCANVLDKCSKGPREAKDLLPTVEHALRLVPGYEAAKLNRAFGLHAATETEGDCTVEVDAPDLIPGQSGDRGGIIRVHDLYRDPLLTDCSRRQSLEAGRTFLKWLQRKEIKVDFIGSSFLMRALQTAHEMFREPCGKTEGLDCDEVFSSESPMLTPIPYMTEKAPEGLSSFQQDNTPRVYELQEEILAKIYGHRQKLLAINSDFELAWPRFAQQYEKFKALLAVVLAPGVSKVAAWQVPSLGDFRTALEAALPEIMHPTDHGKEHVKVRWSTGEYSTGDEFDKKYYEALQAPELNFVVVGHNQMMSEYCLAPEYMPKPNNNAILEKLFILELPSAGGGFQSVKMRELKGKCALVMEAPSKEESLGNLATADVANCSSPLIVSKFLDLQAGVQPDQTACVKCAPESAFAIQPDFM